MNQKEKELFDTCLIVLKTEKKDTVSYKDAKNYMILILAKNSTYL